MLSSWSDCCVCIKELIAFSHVDKWQPQDHLHLLLLFLVDGTTPTVTDEVLSDSWGYV